LGSPAKLKVATTRCHQAYFLIFSEGKFLMLHKRYQFDSSEVLYRAEELVSAASNRYRITVQVANRAKRRRYEDFETMDDPLMKPVLRAIIEMSDELTQPEIIGD
jgi:DNA-directed RNA polymerase subunit omega